MPFAKTYNAFPYCYQSFAALKRQLLGIKYMGFNSVWVNPFIATGMKTIVKRKGKEVTGSLYAPLGTKEFHDYFKSNSGDVEQEVLGFTRQASDLGLITMFDLVMHHVSIDSPLTKDYPYWFKPEGSCQEWDDIRPFNYDDPQIAKEIFEYYWRGMIDWYIDTLGFRGVRVDAVWATHRNIQELVIPYIRKKLHNHGIDDPIVLAEFFHENADKPDSEECRSKQGLGYSHVMNSHFWQPTPSFERAKSGFFDWHNKEMHSKGLLVCREYNGQEFIGGTIGSSGNHDADTLFQACKDRFESDGKELDLGDDGQRKTIELMMKEVIAQAAFGSDCGWYCLSGDEVGDSQAKEPFMLAENSKPLCPFLFVNSTDQIKKGFDLRGYIRTVNSIIDRFGPPQQGFWAEFVVLPEKENVFITVRHSSCGYEGKATIVALDLNTDQPYSLLHNELSDIMNIVASRAKPKDIGKAMASCRIEARDICGDDIIPIEIEVVCA